MNASRTYFLEISTLQELHFTGVPKVTLELARHLLNRSDVEFFFDDYVIPHDVVESLVRSETGLIFSGLAAMKPNFEHILSRVQKAQTSVGIFPHVITRRFFDYHVQVVHDLVFLVAPEYHHPNTVEFHSGTILQDANLADAIICVSKSTADDVISYLRISPTKVHVVHNGVDPVMPLEPKQNPLERFVLVLGTIEPRKNIELVIKYISEHCDVLHSRAFVFCGRDGWLMTFDGLIEKYKLEAEVAAGRIIRLNFISEKMKWELLKRGQLLIFPSLYEGYGLPILESLAVGTPVLASWAASIPEVGGELVRYFDPTDYDDFEAELSEILADNREPEATWKLQALKHAKQNSWQQFAENVFVKCEKL